MLTTNTHGENKDGKRVTLLPPVTCCHCFSVATWYFLLCVCAQRRFKQTPPQNCDGVSLKSNIQFKQKHLDKYSSLFTANGHYIKLFTATLFVEETWLTVRMQKAERTDFWLRFIMSPCKQGWYGSIATQLLSGNQVCDLWSLLVWHLLFLSCFIESHFYVY